ncbi:CTD small phosphatase-like protein 2-A [Alligator sinensis]|uniref:Mitochondrial import inner membrane translocase subunit TIM50 n=1 Tax=Alligator sinensis TaxID=38654 RepID=A0A3Q0G231_ALLSI|nr:CTD small phosphatase-like protein 2-A [Alligator sinensis]XP_025052134.1 CTD small phosphatase-like protein 2-A [Alligator sinensis]
MLLRSGKITPRVKRPQRRRGSGADLGDVEPPTAETSTPQRARSRGRGPPEEGAREPVTPAKGRVARVHFDLDPSSPDNASPPPRRVDGSASPHAPPASEGLYFGGLLPPQPDDPNAVGLCFPKGLPSVSSPRPPRKEVPIKTRSIPESTLVLELEGTLVCCSLIPDRLPDADCTFPADFQGDRYQIFVFTTAKLDYTERILEVLDPQKKLIRHRLYQEDCLCVRGHYLKDLAMLERDLAKTVALDHSLQAYPYQVSNRVPIPSWHGDPQDQELLRLIPVLEKLSQASDVRPEIRRRYRLCRLLAED